MAPYHPFLFGAALRFGRALRVLGNRAEGNTGGFTMKPDPLENLMSKFDITGQTLALQRNGPLPESASSAAKGRRR